VRQQSKRQPGQKYQTNANIPTVLLTREPRGAIGRLGRVSRVANVAVPLPPEVAAAARAFAGHLRLAILHELAGGPKTTTQLMRVLAISDRTTMTENLRELETHGVISGAPAATTRRGRATTWTSHPERIATLTTALAAHVTTH
jgi:DNA-binding HxlR family transcriptional regulator